MKLVNQDGQPTKTEKIADRFDVQVKALKTQATRTLDAMKDESIEHLRIRLDRMNVLSIYQDKQEKEY